MIIAWGSRGDMQPVAALALGLKSAGREVLVFATPPATDLFRSNGIDCVEAEEDVGKFIEALFGQADPSDRSISGVMKLAKFCKEYMNSPEYVATQKADMESGHEAAKRFRPDLVVVPNLFYGPFMCIAEALQVPVVTFDLQVNHPTSELPLFTMELGKAPKCCNSFVYAIKARIYPKTIKPKFGMIRKMLGLPIDKYTDGSRFKVWPHDLPQVCACSPAFIGAPGDWPDTKYMSGWWFLSSGAYAPPPELAAFLREHKPVYAGFGSMKGSPEFCAKLSTLAINGLKLAGVKGVLLGGWAGLSRQAIDASTEEGRALRAWAEHNVFEIDSCPHDWLFPQCAAVVHHGGAGTLSAGIRAGCPAIVCATQGDQPFHGSVAQARGVGKFLGMIGSKTVTAEALGKAIQEVTCSQAMAAAAREMAESVRAEDGVANAIQFMDKMATSFPYPWPIIKQGP